MVVVKKQKGESDDKLIARFRKKVTLEKLIIEARDRAHHKTDSDKRKERADRIKRQRDYEKRRRDF